MKKSAFSSILFLVFCAGSFYSYGTAMMDYFLVYPSRFLVGESEFIAYHGLLEKAIWPISVAPFLIIILLNGVLLWKSPENVSKKLLVASFVLLMLDFASTVFFQAPWNIQLANGKDVELMQKITDTNWVRVFLESAQAVLVFVLMYRSYSGSKEQSLTEFNPKNQKS
jgi:uncharacterized membrane protein